MGKIDRSGNPINNMKIRHTSVRHVLAILRQMLGLTQAEFAKLVGVARSSIVSIECNNGRLGLSRKLARNISELCGVSCEWLTRNDLFSPPVTPDGRPYSAAVFATIQVKSPVESEAAKLFFGARLHGPAMAIAQDGL